MWRATTYHIILVGRTSLRHLLCRLILAVSVMPEHASMCHIVSIESLHRYIDMCKQAGQQRTTTGCPKTFNQLLVAPNHEDRWQYLLQYLFWLAVVQAPGRVRKPTHLHRAC
jgi:hypothetical protein